jgi:hypothetical protein
MSSDATRPKQARVTVEALRALATVDRKSLFRDATALVDCDEGVIAVPWKTVSAVLAGETRFTRFRLLYDRSTFAEDGVITGRAPRTIDRSDLDARLAVIADGINDD